jgi:hypothetical protein
MIVDAQIVAVQNVLVQATRQNSQLSALDRGIYLKQGNQYAAGTTTS